jgi:hypothetical protein
MDNAKSGIELIAEERQRQIEKEGWTADHDINHTGEELAFAAACYVTPNDYRDLVDGIPNIWPFEDAWWKPKPHDRVRELIKAGALIAAEIDRLNQKKVYTEQELNDDWENNFV